MKLHPAGFIQALVFAVVFLLFISGEAGWILIYCMLAAIAASIVTCAVSHKHISVSCGSFAGVYRLGQEVTAELHVGGRGFCILPFVVINGFFMGKPFSARCSVFGKRGGCVKITMRAEECCLNRLDIEQVQIRDFFGIIVFSSPVRPEPGAAAVLPGIVEYSGPEVIPPLLPSDEDEETERPALSGGMPGYEHRGYVPGDSPRRINYKLSAKKRTLLVRRDEGTATERVEIVLAPGADCACAEQAFALSQKLISGGGSVRVIFAGESFPAASPAEVCKLREWLAFRDLHGSGGGSGPVRSASLSHTVVTISPGGITVQ